MYCKRAFFRDRIAYIIFIIFFFCSFGRFSICHLIECEPLTLTMTQDANVRHCIHKGCHRTQCPSDTISRLLYIYFLFICVSNGDARLFHPDGVSLCVCVCVCTCTHVCCVSTYVSVCVLIFYANQNVWKNRRSTTNCAHIKTETHIKKTKTK